MTLDFSAIAKLAPMAFPPFPPSPFRPPHSTLTDASLLAILDSAAPVAPGIEVLDTAG